MSFVLRSSTFQFFSINCRKFFELCQPFMNRNNKRKNKNCVHFHEKKMIAANLKRIDIGSIVSFPFLFLTFPLSFRSKCIQCEMISSSWTNTKLLCVHQLIDRYYAPRSTYIRSIKKKKKIVIWIDQTAISRLKCYPTYLRILLFKRATKIEQNKRQRKLKEFKQICLHRSFVYT